METQNTNLREDFQNKANDQNENSSLDTPSLPAALLLENFLNSKEKKTEEKEIEGNIELTSTMDKSKENNCDYCDRCEKCEAEFQKDEAKKKKKKDVESKLEALNYLICIIVAVAIVITQLAIWINLKQNSTP